MGPGGRAATGLDSPGRGCAGLRGGEAGVATHPGWASPSLAGPSQRRGQHGGQACWAGGPGTELP